VGGDHDVIDVDVHALQRSVHEAHAPAQVGEFLGDGLMNPAMIRRHFDVDSDGDGQRIVEQQHHLTEQAIARLEPPPYDFGGGFRNAPRPFSITSL
jgi:hypothetical protein